MTDQSDARTLIRHVLETTPSGFLTDIDGTISAIAPNPDSATVHPDARAALNQLAGRLALVAAISGRSAVDARRLVSLDTIVYSGNHGMEWWRNGELQQSQLAAEHAPRINALLDRLEAELRIPGIRYEPKGLTASIHVRETEHPDDAEGTVFNTATRLADEMNLKVTRGRMVIEIRPPIELDKGSSVRDLIQAFRLNGAVYLGDDVTDIDAFRALQEYRQRSDSPFYSIAVESDETPAAVVATADATVTGVTGVVELLQFAVEQLASTDRDD